MNDSCISSVVCVENRNYEGNDLDPLSLKELQTLEHQLDNALKRIRTKKVNVKHTHTHTRTNTPPPPADYFITIITLIQ